MSNEQKKPETVFEAMDTTLDELYYSLGLWLSLEEAVEALEKCKEPADVGSDGWEYRGDDDYFEVTIQERILGWPTNDLGKPVATMTWRADYNEAEDEYVWKRETKRSLK